MSTSGVFVNAHLLMIQRVVQLTFREDAVPTFLNDVFEPSKTAIRAFPGCQSMALLRDTQHPHVLFTLSVWESAEALEHYRQSDLFRTTWTKTKALFDGKPEAWSLEVLNL
jgi:quinol monooxygenase YgiN